MAGHDPDRSPRPRRGSGQDRLAGHVAVVERHHVAAGGLRGLVALAGDHARGRRGGPRRRRRRSRPGGRARRRRPLRRRSPARDRGDDRLGVLAAGVVGRDEDPVGQPGGDLAHPRPLAGVAVATGAEHHQQPAARCDQLARRLEQHVLEAVGGVGVVDDDAEVLAGVDGLEATRHRRGGGQAGGDVVDGRHPARRRRWPRRARCATLNRPAIGSGIDRPPPAPRRAVDGAAGARSASSSE